MRYANKAKGWKLVRRCSGCGKKMPFASTGKFRVNANGRRLDVWLIYRCETCGRTLNVPVYERTAPERLGQELYRGFLENDPELAERFAGDRGFLKSRGFQLEKR